MKIGLECQETVGVQDDEVYLPQEPLLVSLVPRPGSKLPPSCSSTTFSRMVLMHCLDSSGAFPVALRPILQLFDTVVIDGHFGANISHRSVAWGMFYGRKENFPVPCILSGQYV